MPPETIENRVDHLERRVTALETLPDRMTAVESQIVQLRAEMRGEFSAVREEIRAGDEETRRVLGERIDETARCSASGSTRTAATCACCTRTSSGASRLFRKGSRHGGAGEKTAEVAGSEDARRHAVASLRPQDRCEVDARHAHRGPKADGDRHEQDEAHDRTERDPVERLDAEQEGAGSRLREQQSGGKADPDPSRRLANHDDHPSRRRRAEGRADTHLPGSHRRHRFGEDVGAEQRLQ